MSDLNKHYTGALDECPCRDCVPPKRWEGCHSACPDYAAWNAARQQYLERYHREQYLANACYPPYRPKKWKWEQRRK
jgi:hypothetical protein